MKSAKRDLAAGRRIKASIVATVRDGAGNVCVTAKQVTLKTQH